MWNCSQVIAPKPHKWEVNIGLGQRANTWANVDQDANVDPDLFHHML